MGLDNIISSVYNCFDDLEKEKNCEIKINNKFVKNSDSLVLKVILPAWGDGDEFITNALIRRLYKKGNSCLSYIFPSDILSSDVNKTIVIFNWIKEQVKTEIKKLKELHNFKQIDIIAPSLAVVSACLIANDNDDISNLYLIVPGSCLASSLWSGIRTEKLKNIYEKQNINLGKLKNIWEILAPKNNIDALDNKKIHIVISKSDKVIPYQFGKELANMIENLYPKNTSIDENKFLGHYLTVLRYYLFDKVLLG